MHEADYNMLCLAIESQWQDALRTLEQEFEEKRRAIASLWNDADQEKRSCPWLHKKHGNLIEAVRQAALQLGADFTLADIESVLRREQPVVHALSSRKSISTALRRLYRGRQLVLLEEGRGTKPARYSVASAIPLHQGKEIPHEHCQR